LAEIRFSPSRVCRATPLSNQWSVIAILATPANPKIAFKSGLGSVLQSKLLGEILKNMSRNFGKKNFCMDVFLRIGPKVSFATDKSTALLSPNQTLKQLTRVARWYFSNQKSQFW
jgi:hypothetical protein